MFFNRTIYARKSDRGAAVLRANSSRLCDGCSLALRRMNLARQMLKCYNCIDGQRIARQVTFSCVRTAVMAYCVGDDSGVIRRDPRMRGFHYARDLQTSAFTIVLSFSLYLYN